METNNIDSIFRKSIRESEGHYDTEAENAKDKIWNQVQQKQRQFTPVFLRLLVAACIVLFFSSSMLTFYIYKSQKTIGALTELNNELNTTAAKNNNQALINDESPNTTLHTIDTVYIEKELIVNKTIVQTKQIIDTVFIEHIVYIERELETETLMAIGDTKHSDSSFMILTDNYETEIIISKKEDVSKKKRKKFQINFGGNNNKSSGNLALTSKL